MSERQAQRDDIARAMALPSVTQEKGWRRSKKVRKRFRNKLNVIKRSMMKDA